jgi:hypothetical protein
MSFGGGKRWREEQREVLDHAEGLGYDHYAGGSLIEETDDKAKWVAWRDKFGDFKSDQLAKPQEQRWWVTRPWESAPAPESGGGGSSSGGLLNPLPEIGPYPERNIYDPVLETAYTPPVAQDWSQYMPVGGLLTGGAQARYPQAIFPPLDEAGGVLSQTPSAPITDGAQFDIGGLLYQPWTTEYQQAFVPGNIWQYDPNQFGVGKVAYSENPFPLNLPEDWEELLGPFEEEEEDEESNEPNPDQKAGDG